MVEGIYTDEEILVVHAIGHPPCEKRRRARYVRPLSFCTSDDGREIDGHFDFLGRGATTLMEDVSLASQSFDTCKYDSRQLGQTG